MASFSLSVPVSVSSSRQKPASLCAASETGVASARAPMYSPLRFLFPMPCNLDSTPPGPRPGFLGTLTTCNHVRTKGAPADDDVWQGVPGSPRRTRRKPNARKRVRNLPPFPPSVAKCLTQLAGAGGTREMFLDRLVAPSSHGVVPPRSPGPQSQAAGTGGGPLFRGRQGTRAAPGADGKPPRDSDSSPAYYGVGHDSGLVRARQGEALPSEGSLEYQQKENGKMGKWENEPEKSPNKSTMATRAFVSQQISGQVTEAL